MTDIATQLTTSGYNKLFFSLDDTQLNAVWNAPDAPQRLATLVNTSSASTQARFLAAEVLFAKQADYPPNEQRALLASVYVAALQHTKSGDMWGLPGTLDGPAGAHIVGLGDATIDALKALLNDERQVSYGGSEDAMTGNGYQYRVKDFAAFYIGKIAHIDYTVDEDPQVRDQAIEQLQATLGSMRQL